MRKPWRRSRNPDSPEAHAAAIDSMIRRHFSIAIDNVQLAKRLVDIGHGCDERRPLS